MIRRALRVFSFTSFRSKLVAVSVVCLLLPALITLIMYNYMTRDAVKAQAVAGAQQTLQLVDGHVTNTLKQMLYLLNYIQWDPGVSLALRQWNAPDMRPETATYEQTKARFDLLEKIDSLTGAGEKSYLTIMLNNGTFFTNYQLDEYNPAGLMKEPWLEKARQVRDIQSYWVGTTQTVFRSDRVAHPYQLTVVRPLLDGTGYVVVTILESQISQYFKQLATGQEVMLLDANDRILSHADPKKIGETFPYLAEAAQNQEKDIVRINGDDYLLSKRDLSVNGWKIASLTPYTTAVSKINAIFEKVFTFQLFSFILFFILLLVALRAFTQPLVRLDKVAVAIQKGDLAVRSTIRGQDEIGRLGKSFDQMLDRISDMIVEVTQTQARKRQAELNMLQAQINPHFLFNVLNSIRMKVLGKGDRESADMISSLSKLLRMTIQEKGYITLHEEVDTVLDYVRLMNMRQKQKVQLEVDIDSGVFLENVPRFFLQPIIENALIHGLSQQAGTIRLEAHVTDGIIRICVSDDGQGMDEATLARLRGKLTLAIAEPDAVAESRKGFSGIGLPNVYERMRMTFGEAFRMEVDSEPGQGTRVALYIPRQEEEKHV